MRGFDAERAVADLLFADPRSRALLTRIERVAGTDLTVLVTGETGTGKEGVAHLLHARSRRAGARFVAVNCAAIAPSLLEAELFGHAKGAFTGAVAESEGWFEAAQGGTLFLDEVGDLPLAAQAKLLRVLQEREVVRVGARKAMPLDVRVIAATNADLARAVSEGRFREDLFYRLHVAPIELLPLRERPADILPLAERFLARGAEQLGLAGAALTPGARAKLLVHAWPGNVRELENAMHVALLVSPDAVVDAGALHLAERPAARPAPGAPAAREEQSLASAVLALLEHDHAALHEHIEATVLRTVYDFTDRNQVRTAKLLGLSRNIVRARLAQYGMLPKVERRGPATPTSLDGPRASSFPEPIPITRRSSRVASSRVARRR